jgi:hypothetical protein
MTPRTGARAAALAVLALCLSVVTAARAADDEGAVVRVIAEEAEVRTGPGFAYRTVYLATRGETLHAERRASRDYWFHVVLPDGTYGWIVGDQVLPLDVDPTAPAPPTLGRRMADAVFSPAPLPTGEVSLSFSAGVLGGEGLILFRPAVLVAPHLGLEAFVGETVGEQLDVVYYGAGANIYLWPSSPVTLFVAAGGGGAYGRKKADQFTIRPGHYATANVGGGLLIALKKRITVRFDFRDYVLFGPNYTHELEEFSGGLAVVF